MALGVRGSNPIWAEFNLAGKIFDDTYYMWVLENQIPYIPATVYHDPDLSVAWTQPIQFLGNGTLPIDIFFESDVVYRLEFRQHIGLGTPSQSDPLIYLVENYVAGTGGSTPVNALAFSSDNQITNPQFAFIDFSSPFSLSATNPASIQIGPGWFLDLAGTGTVTITQVPLNNTNSNQSNAPYALRLQLSGWTLNSVFLRQRFQQNGMLWANKIVSSTITARLGPDSLPQTIIATLIDSNSTTLASVLSATVNQSFNEFTGHGQLPATSNPNLPPVAYIDYKLSIPSNIDIYVSSIQLIVQELPLEPTYEQTTIERQSDQTFHNYKYELITKPKDSILSGWDFSLNPFQIYPTAVTQVTPQCSYVADQTILYQQTASALDVGKSSAATRYGLVVQSQLSGAAANKFAIIQYVDPTTIRQYWSYIVSSLVRARIFTAVGTQVGIKMRLIVNPNLPTTLSSSEPIVNMTGTDPVFSGNWTAYAPLNDPTYILPNAYSSFESPGGDAFPAFSFDGFNLPDCTTSTQTIGIVLYTTAPMSTSPQDNIIFDSISLVPNRFAVASNPKTFDETLRECEFYLETSYPLGILPGGVDSNNLIIKSQPYFINASFNQITLTPANFDIQFNVIKRTLMTGSNMSFYTPGGGSAGFALAELANGNTVVNSGSLSISTWQPFAFGTKLIQYTGNATAQLITNQTPVNPYCLIKFHYVADARLGVF